MSGHTQPVRALSFAADGALASGGEDATVLVWSLDATALRESRLSHRQPEPDRQEEWTEFMLERELSPDLPRGSKRGRPAPGVATPVAAGGSPGATTWVTLAPPLRHLGV